MTLSTSFALRLFLLGALSFSLSAQPAPLTAEQIVGKVIDALGGADELAKVDTVRIRGRMRFGAGEFKPFSVLAQRPARFRMELTIGADHVTQAYDGAIGWQSVDGEHKQEPAALTGLSLAHLIDQAANVIGGPLVEHDQRHNKVELAGSAKVDGVDCHQLKVTLSTGDTMTLFIDSSTFREVREELPIQVNGTDSTIEQSVGDYRRFGKILVACLFVTRQKGGEDTQRLELDSVEFNVPVNEGVFKIPTAQ